MSDPKVWLRSRFGQGEPKEVEATPKVLVPLMVTGWSQCEPPEPDREGNEDAHH